MTEPEFKEYDIVKVVKLLMPNHKRGNMGAADIRRDPLIGDTGTIVHIHSAVNGLEQGYIVECCDKEGRPYWLADFLQSELEIVYCESKH